MRDRVRRRLRAAWLASASAIAAPAMAAPPAVVSHPWLDASRTPDERATLAVRHMTLDEKIALVDGKFGVSSDWLKPIAVVPKGAIGSAAYEPAIPRLGLPALQETDAGLGVADPVDMSGKPVRGTAGYATAFPSGLALAATWNPDLARATGEALGREAALEGFNVILAGGADLTRDPRDGRDFEYAGEDPWLTGTIVGHEIAGIQSQHVVSTIKHFALNDSETNRFTSTTNIAWPAARESDLLAFEIAIAIGHPGSVMCSYNEINGVHTCADPILLDRILKGDWHYPGWVMSDWGAVHAATDANAGLDQESGDYIDQMNGGPFFDAKLRAALKSGTVKPARLDDMVHRILRAEFATGLVDHPAVRGPIPVAEDAAAAQATEEQGAVLLRNQRGALPLAHDVASVAVIGGNAANGVLEGGGSSQVWPIGGPAAPVDHDTRFPHPVIWDPSPPLAAIRATAPHAAVSWSDGRSIPDAVAAAKRAKVAIVFVDQETAEGFDLPDLSLPKDPVTGTDQDALVTAVAAANPHTIVVVESGGPVLMPWLTATAGVLEAWYPGSAGGPAIARLLFGDANPSGHLPITFPANVDQLPRPTIGDGQHVDDNIEGAAVGYKWFARRDQTPLFPFGAGLSYTSFAFSNLHATAEASPHLSVDIANTGRVAGQAVAQFYVRFVPNMVATPFRLVGYAKVALAPGEHRTVAVQVDPRLLASFDGTAHRWHIAAGQVQILAGTSSADLSQETTLVLGDQTLEP